MLRVIELPVEIKQHLLVWRSDPYFKKMDKSIQNYVKDFIDLLDIVEKNPEVVEIKEKGNNEIKGAQRFIGLFQGAYEKLIGTKCTENFNGITIRIYGTQIKKILEAYGTVDEYIEWLFNDFFMDKRNQNLLPPNANFCMSSNMVDKFLYVKKDVFLSRRKDNIEMEKREKFVKILKELYNIFNSKELGQTIIKLARNEITLRAAYKIVKDFCIENNDNETIEKIEKILLKK